MRRLLFATYRRLYWLDRWTRRRFTIPGLVVVSAMVGALVVGVDVRQNLAYQVFTLLAALIAISFLASIRYRPEFAVERDLPRFATVDEPATYRVRIANGGKRHERDLEVADELAQPWPTFAELQASRGPPWSRSNRVDAYLGYTRWTWLIARRRGADIVPTKAPTIPARGRVSVELVFTPRRRGYLRFDRLRLAHPDPLGLCRSSAHFEILGSVLVVPKTYPVPQIRFEGGRRYQRGGITLAQSIGNEAEFVALREYRPGDPLKLIHWRSFAKLGKPVVREMHDEFFTRYALVLDTFTEGLKDDRFESAVSVAASVAIAERGLESLLDLMFVGASAYQFTSGRGVGQDDELLEVLACVEPALDHDFERLSNLVLEHLGGLSGCFLVLLRWDKARAALVSSLRLAGIRTAVILVGEHDAASEGHVVRPDHIEEDLARWTP